MNVIHSQQTDHPTSNAEFTDELALAVRLQIARGAHSFSDLAEKVEGAWPLETLSILRLLTKRGEVSSAFLEALMAGNTSADPLRSPTQLRLDILPEPHPLNFDWRFTPGTQDFLMKTIESFNHDFVALLGTPTLLRPLLARKFRTRLFDQNASLREILEAEERKSFQEADLTQPLKNANVFTVAAADPPWYSEYYEAFVYRLSDLLIPGGSALLSVLPRLTRPGAAEDRVNIVSVAYDAGLDLVDVIPDSLAYTTPPFEAEALKVEDLVLPAWRRSDLYIFEKAARPVQMQQRISMPESTVRQGWRTFTFNKTSIAVRCEAAAAAAFSFQGVSASGRLTIDSVSRRSSSRRYANIWSSRNHVLHATRTDCVCRLLELLTAGIKSPEALDLIEQEFMLDRSSMREIERLVEALKECLS